MTERSRRRADADRNRTRILEAARQVFADEGPAARMSAVARRAGVAVGTLYNHYPTKEALLGAAIADRVDEATAAARATLDRLDAGGDPWDEFAGLFRTIAAAQSEDRAFKAAAAALGVAAPYEEVAGELLAVVTEVLDRAKAAGVLRRDVDAQDLALLLAGIPGADTPPDIRDRHLDIVLRGLRPAP